MKSLVLLNPWVLLLLAVVLPMGFLLRRQARLQEDARRLLNAETDLSPKAYTLRCWKLLAALVFIVVGLSRPAHSPTPRAISQGGRDIIFALDVSRSMLAEDAKPSRLEKAKADIKNCIAHNPGVRVGLVVFAGSANVKVPLTMDHEFFRLAVEEVGPTTVAQGSTILQAAFEKIADRLMDEERLGYQDLILLSDGEDLGSNEEQVVSSLEGSSLRLMVLGYGDATIGARIPLGAEEGETSYMMHEGYDVWTRLEEPRLQAVARAGESGRYVNATRNDFLLSSLYREWAAEAPLQPLSVDGDLIYKELYPLCFAIAVLLLIPLPRKVSPQVASLVLSLLFVFPAMGQEGAGGDWDARVAEITGHMGKGEWPEAMELISELAGYAQNAESTAQCSTFQAVCAAHMSDSGGAASERLSWAEQGIAHALESLLAKPRDVKVQRLLEGLAQRRVAALVALAQEQKDEEQTANILEEIVEALQEIVEREEKLLGYSRTLLPPRPRKGPVPPPTDSYLPEQIAEQALVNEKTVDVTAKVKSLVEMVTTMLRASENLPADLPVPTEFDEVYALVQQGEAQLKLALPAIKVLSSLRVGADHQQRGLNHLKEALEALQGQQNSGESDEYSDEDYEDYEDWEESYGEEGEMSSMPAMSGASRSDFVNRALPTPDYSVEDLLAEEMENNLERAKKRAAQSGGVEKDW